MASFILCHRSSPDIACLGAGPPKQRSAGAFSHLDGLADPACRNGAGAPKAIAPTWLSGLPGIGSGCRFG